MTTLLCTDCGKPAGVEHESQFTTHEMGWHRFAAPTPQPSLPMSAEPTQDTTPSIRIVEQVARHANGHLVMDRFPAYLPTPDAQIAACNKLSQAWPVLATHAQHMDGMFDLTLTEVRGMFVALNDEIAALNASLRLSTDALAAAQSENARFLRLLLHEQKVAGEATPSLGDPLAQEEADQCVLEHLGRLRGLSQDGEA